MNPTFIVGVGRSGTTLLVNLLGAHPSLAPIYETPFLRKVIRFSEKVISCNGWRLFRAAPALGLLYLRRESRKLRKNLIASTQELGDPASIKQKYEHFPFGLTHCIAYTPQELARETDLWLNQLLIPAISEEAVLRSTRGFIDRLFSIHAQRLNKPFWINKTPALLNYADRLHKLFPAANCIHILRDGRDLSASLLSLPWGPKTIQEAALHWKRHIVNGRQLCDESKLKYLEIRYEDLIASTGQTLEQIFSFLQMSADVAAIADSLPVDKARTGRWKTTFTPVDRKLFAREAGDLLIELGYERDDGWTNP